MFLKAPFKNCAHLARVNSFMRVILGNSKPVLVHQVQILLWFCFWKKIVSLGCVIKMSNEVHCWKREQMSMNALVKMRSLQKHRNPAACAQADLQSLVSFYTLLASHALCSVVS